ncbi:hypothetical protein L6452_42791 [Arctium lappa]|uniref:Uncharacterized protein n=1 Tax=Arctium lappa TaxID=4217 RepID=A0ACB8XJG7_ARCLA|nr:hypothetical protein L6452_42791 [Arctium lappa]
MFPSSVVQTVATCYRHCNSKTGHGGRLHCTAFGIHLVCILVTIAEGGDGAIVGDSEEGEGVSEASACATTNDFDVVECHDFDLRHEFLQFVIGENRLGE